MPEDAPTGAAGETVITEPVVPAPSATGSQDDVVQITSDRDAAIARSRSEQARADRAEAALAAATKPTVEATSPAPGLTAEGVMELMQRTRALDKASETLRTEFPNADSSIFDNALTYTSVEAMRAKAEDSHTAFQVRLDALDVVPKSEIEALKARFTAKYGPIEETPVVTEGNATGEPTVEQVRGWYSADMDAYAKQHGEEKLAALLRSAS